MQENILFLIYRPHRLSDSSSSENTLQQGIHIVQTSLRERPRLLFGIHEVHLFWNGYVILLNIHSTF